MNALEHDCVSACNLGSASDLVTPLHGLATSPALGRSMPGRPYIWHCSIFNRLICPRGWPFDLGPRRAACAASTSPRGPRAKEARRLALAPESQPDRLSAQPFRTTSTSRSFRARVVAKAANAVSVRATQAVSARDSRCLAVIMMTIRRAGGQVPRVVGTAVSARCGMSTIGLPGRPACCLHQ